MYLRTYGTVQLQLHITTRYYACLRVLTRKEPPCFTLQRRVSHVNQPSTSDRHVWMSRIYTRAWEYNTHLRTYFVTLNLPLCGESVHRLYRPTLNTIYDQFGNIVTLGRITALSPKSSLVYNIAAMHVRTLQYVPFGY